MRVINVFSLPTTQADKIPEIGDEIRVGNYVFTVTQADERRIIEASFILFLFFLWSFCLFFYFVYVNFFPPKTRF